MWQSDSLVSTFVQLLLRGTAILAVSGIICLIMRRSSAAHRAVVRQMTFLSLALSGLLYLLLPGIPVPASGSSDAAMSAAVAADAPNQTATIAGVGPGVGAATQPLDVGNGSEQANQSAAATAVPSQDMLAAPPSPGSPTTPPVASAPQTVMPTTISDAAPQPAAVMPAPARPDYAWLGALIGSIWAVGAGISLAGIAAAMLRLRKLASSSRPAPAELQALLQAAKWDLGISRNISLRIAAPGAGLQAPAAWGFFSPTIMAPELLIRETAARQSAAITHEAAHIARGDWFWLILSRTVCSLYWCLPFVWPAANALRRDTEMACDDAVLTAGSEPADYAAQLLDTARSMSASRQLSTDAALTLARPPLAAERIRAILAENPRRRPASLRVVLVCALLAIAISPVAALRTIDAVPAPDIRVESALTAPESAEPVTPAANVVAVDPPVRTDVFPAPTVPVGPAQSGRTIVPGSDRAPIGTATPAAANLPAATVSSPIAWGPETNGLQAGLRMENPKTRYAPGELIWQDVYLRNHTRDEVILTASGGYEEQGDPQVQMHTGPRVKVLRYFGMGALFVRETRVPAGDVIQVGRYVLVFDGASPPETRHEPAPGISMAAENGPIALSGPGEYSLRQQVFAVRSDGLKPTKPIVTGAQMINVGGKPVRESLNKNGIQDLSTAPIAWGPVRSGIQAGLMFVSPKSLYFTGERVQAVVVLRSVANHTISFWHETSFAFVDSPTVVTGAGEWKPAGLLEPDWSVVGHIRMAGVTFDMTSAPSASGQSRLRRSEIQPGEAILGYSLASFRAPKLWPNGKSAVGRSQVRQTLRIGLGEAEGLDTILTTGLLDIDIADSDH